MKSCFVQVKTGCVLDVCAGDLVLHQINTQKHMIYYAMSSDSAF